MCGTSNIHRIWFYLLLISIYTYKYTTTYAGLTSEEVSLTLKFHLH